MFDLGCERKQGLLFWVLMKVQ